MVSGEVGHGIHDRKAFRQAIQAGMHALTGKNVSSTKLKTILVDDAHFGNR